MVGFFFIIASIAFRGSENSYWKTDDFWIIILGQQVFCFLWFTVQTPQLPRLFRDFMLLALVVIFSRFFWPLPNKTPGLRVGVITTSFLLIVRNLFPSANNI